jgi:hypothetical protein
MQTNESAFAPLPNGELSRGTTSDSCAGESAEGVSVSWYDKDVPAFAEAELARLYGSLFSSIPFYRVYGGLDDAMTYVARRDGAIRSVFLFIVRAGRIQVMNETMTLDGEEVRQFAAQAFAKFRSANEIRFRAVAIANPETIRHAHHRFRYTDDIVLALPATEDDYVARLGKSTRKNIKHHLSRAKRCLAGFRHEVHCGGDASEEDIRAIVGFNRQRMAGKNKLSSLDEDETERLVRLVRLCGLVSLIRIDGRIRAGAICFQVGTSFMSSVNAHDPAYDDFRLGTLCCYLTILECIRREGKEFHFMWGRYEYKFSLLGVLRCLDQVSIYRSRARMLMSGATIMRNACKSRLDLMKLRLIDESKKNNPMARNAMKVLRAVRMVRGRASGRTPGEPRRDAGIGNDAPG